MIEVGSFVKIVKERPYDFMEKVFLQVLKVADVYENDKGETVLELMADEFLIQEDSYLRFKNQIGFLIDEVELTSEDEILQGRIDNFNYRRDKKVKEVEWLNQDLKEFEVKLDTINKSSSNFERTTPHQTWLEVVNEIDWSKPMS